MYYTRQTTPADNRKIKQTIFSCWGLAQQFLHRDKASLDKQSLCNKNMKSIVHFKTKGKCGGRFAGRCRTKSTCSPYPRSSPHLVCSRTGSIQISRASSVFVCFNFTCRALLTPLYCLYTQLLFCGLCFHCGLQKPSCTCRYPRPLPDRLPRSVILSCGR